MVGGPAGALAGYKVGSGAANAVAPKSGTKEIMPGIPTIDEAAQNRQVADRIRRRRGVMANIYGGALRSAPSAGTKAVLG